MRNTTIKFLLVLIVAVMLITAFAGCQKKNDISIDFISNDKVISNAVSVEEAKEILESQPSMDGYVFKGWFLDQGVWQQQVKAEDVEQYIQNGKLNVYAYWVEIVDGITITFFDYTGAYLIERQFNRDDVDFSFLKASQKPDDDKYTYTFAGWDCDMSDLTKSHYNAYPVYDKELRTFNVEYVVDNKVVYTQKVVYGNDADTAIIAEPKKESTPEYDYIFEKWEGNYQNITSDCQLIAKFTQVKRQYTVTFHYGNNEVMTQKVEYGQTAHAPSGDMLNKNSDQMYDYTFIGWDNNGFECVSENLDIHALYNPTLRCFTVDFYMDDMLLKSQSVVYGQSAEAPEKVIKPDDKVNSYEFAGWDKTFDNIRSDLVVNAVFREIPIIYTVTFLNWNDEILDAVEVGYGQSAVFDGTPERDDTDMYEYEFIGWSQSINNVTENITVVAQYSQKIKEFSVVFNYGDNNSETQTVQYGQSAIAPENTQKSPTESTSFEFIGWDNSFEYVTGNIVVNAVYREDIRQFEVKFMVDDECVKSQVVLYGQSATAPETVVKVTDDGYTYQFIGWDKSFDNITENTIVWALFDKISHKYVVQYVNWDGELLFVDEVETDQTSVYEGQAPQREANDRYTYEFVDWTDSESLLHVKKDMTVYAQYEAIERTFSVVFNYGHDQSVTIENVPYGTDLTDRSNEFGAQVPENTEKTSTAQYDYTFIDWNKYFGYISYDMVIDAIYKETIRKYIVSFVNDGNIIKTQEVEYGSYPTAPEIAAFKNDTAQYDYTYLGWSISESDIVENTQDFVEIDVNNTKVVGEVTYTAVYLREIQHYSVIFYNDKTGNDYSVVAEIIVPYGTNLLDSNNEFYNQVPVVTKDSTVKYDYTFAGWNKDISFIQSDMEVYSTYSSTIRKYSVKFMNDNELWAEYSVEYGSESPIPEDPTKQSTAEFDFVFIGWIGNTKFIEGDTTIEANYRNDLRYYQISFYNLSTNQFIETVEMGYGSSITKTIEREGYTFDSWYKDPDCNNLFSGTVEGPMTLFGNLVMDGFTFSGNMITGYNGTNRNIVVPKAANGVKITKIKGNDDWSTNGGAFQDNTLFDTIFIPSTIEEIGGYAFLGVENIKIFVQSENKWTGAPDGWNRYWAASYVGDMTAHNKEIVYNIIDFYQVGDYEYIMSRDEFAIINSFVNNNTARAYIEQTVNFDLITFVENVYVDEKTQISYSLYEANKTNVDYAVTQISYRAFKNAENVRSIFIPDTISDVEDYAFTGVSANIYIQREKPLLGEVPSGWGLNWNSNEGSDEGTREIYWGVIGMEQVGDFTYIFMNDQTAVAAEYNGSTLATSVEVPAKVTYLDTEYTVTELGAELLANMNLLNTVKLNEGLKKIGEKAFYMDILLSSINLPSTLEEIGGYAFVATNALKEIYIPASVDTIGLLCFAGSSATIYCGVEKAPIYLPGISGYATYWNVKLGFEDISKITSIEGIWDLVTNAQELPTYYNVKYIYTVKAEEIGRSTTFKYILYNDNNARLIGFDGGLNLNVESYNIPSTIEYNGETFNVVSIGANALNGAKLKNLYIPASVTYIEANGFAGCAGMTITTDHTAKPDEWVDGFNPDNCTINYKVSA